MRAKPASQYGFTLVELSIVIAVVAILLGGILASREAIKGATTRATLSQVTEIMSAVEQFEELYRYLPGDLLNAENYWGTQCATPASDCNGNGNWEIDHAASSTEDNRAFQHLQLADLYNKGTTYSTSLVPGSSIPEAPLTSGGFWLATYDGMHGRDQGNALILAAREDDDALDAGVIDARTAYEMDNKVDDGDASTGYLQAAYGVDAGSGCVDGAWTDVGVSYILSDEDKNCRLAFFYNLRP